MSPPNAASIFLCWGAPEEMAEAMREVRRRSRRAGRGGEEGGEGEGRGEERSGWKVTAEEGGGEREPLEEGEKGKG